jgi:parallel beta-helix repeat protein
MGEVGVRLRRLPGLFAAALIAIPSVTWAASSIELYGNFHTMGVIVTIDVGDDPDDDAVATVEYRTGGAPFSEGFPLTRTRPTQLVGSLFWLEPGTAYDVRVTFDDPDGILHGVTFQTTGSTRSEITIPPAVGSLYVSPSGSGTACTLAVPCSLAEGLSQAQPGDEVVLRGGVYHQGEISFPRSGSEGAPIVVRAHDGETPILDGSDPQVFAWSHIGGGVYRTTVNQPDPHLVMADGERLYPYQSSIDLQNLIWGIPGFRVSGTTLDVRLAGDADPNGAAMIVTRFNRAFYVDQDFIYLVGLTFRYYGLGSYAKAIYLDGASDNLIRGCTIEVCDLGIGLKRASHRNLIEDNDFSDTIFDWPWDAVKGGSSLETGGVSFYDPLSGRGNVIRRNTFHDDFDGFGVCPGTDTGTTCETDVYGNLGYDLGDDGVSTDGYCSNVRLWDNTFHDLLVGVSFAPAYTGPVYALRNLIYRIGEGNNSYSGMPFKFNSGYPGSGTMYLFHNTCDAFLPGNDGFEIRSGGSWENVVSRNNIWSGTQYALSNSNPSQPLDMDWDDLHTTTVGELAWWSGLPDRHLNTLAELQDQTGQEPNGVNVNPGFSDPASGNYTLAATSELIDAGLYIPGINDGFDGSAPDIGAFERGDTIFSDGFESGDNSAWSNAIP